MNNTVYLYKQLRLPFFLLVCVFMLGYFFNQNFEKSELLIDQQHKILLKDVDTLYLEVEKLKQKVELVNTYYGRFQLMVEEGLIRQQDRINWIDALMKLVIERDIRHASLSFSARESVTASELLQLKSGIGLLRKEQLILEGKLQHEGDLFSLISKIKLEINPLMQLENCSLVNPQSILDEKNRDYHFHTDGGNFNFKCVFNLLFFVFPQEHLSGNPK